MFVPDSFRGLNKGEIPVAFVPRCGGCDPALRSTYHLHPDVDRMATEPHLNMGYYWDWSSREKSFKACFGIVFENNWGGGDHVEPTLSRHALYKRVPGGRDYDRFGRKEWHEPWGALYSHRYSHFDLSHLDAMLADPSVLPAGVTSWSYWVQP